MRSRIQCIHVRADCTHVWNIVLCSECSIGGSGGGKKNCARPLIVPIRNSPTTLIDSVVGGDGDGGGSVI